MAALRASLEKHNLAFETLISRIPAKHYLPQDDDQVCFTLSIVSFLTQLFQVASKYHKNKKQQQAPKQAIKEASRKARREKARPSACLPVIHADRPSVAQSSEQ